MTAPWLTVIESAVDGRCIPSSERWQCGKKNTVDFFLRIDETEYIGYSRSWNTWIRFSSNLFPKVVVSIKGQEWEKVWQPAWVAWSVIFAHLLPAPLLALGGYDASMSIPFSPCGTQHSDKISSLSPLSLKVFSPGIPVSVSASLFGCGRPWATVGLLPAVQGIDSAAQF